MIKMKNNKKPGRPKKIYLIDACWRGNALRCYFGYAVEEICGCDWDDVPYEHNCERVYPEYVVCVLDALIPFNYSVNDVADETSNGNSQYCREDFKTGEIPLFWIRDNGMDARDDIRFYMGDHQEKVVDQLNLIGCLVKFKDKRVNHNGS